jgi:hypothetical protein
LRDAGASGQGDAGGRAAGRRGGRLGATAASGTVGEAAGGTGGVWAAAGDRLGLQVTLGAFGDSRRVGAGGGRPGVLACVREWGGWRLKK